ncbi:Inosine-5'-monophosphate dehydrogenase [bacterium HR16]|nr:Inosine-5'-monophosphate dehydrogenase [bacterium HR16]
MMLWSLPVERYMTSVPVLSPEDPLAKAVALARAARASTLPVVQDGRLVGVIAESDIARLMQQGDPHQQQYLPVSAAMTRDTLFVLPFTPTTHALQLMQEYGFSSLPVVSQDGEYLGTVLRSDVLALTCDTVRPPMVGGMATPLGVYLTGGGVRAGAGDLGLFLTGVLLMTLNLIALVLVYSGSRWIQQHTGIPLYAMLLSPTASLLDWQDWIGMALRAMPIVLFLLFVRLSPIAGIHAAEHMTVHAIERGEPLEPEFVRRMPRVHPRCGTNLAAGALVFLTLANLNVGIYRDVTLLLAFVTTLLVWRPIGNLLQALFTTRPPSERQLRNGIEVGKQLLHRYQMQGYRPLTLRERIWNMGILQIATGMMVVWWALDILGFGIW